MSDDQLNPFADTQDVNPFAKGIDDYDPFAGQNKPADPFVAPQPQPIAQPQAQSPPTADYHDVIGTNEGFEEPVVMDSGDNKPAVVVGGSYGSGGNPPPSAPAGDAQNPYAYQHEDIATVPLDNSNPNYLERMEEEPSSKYAWCTIAFYRQFFDVDSQDVIKRCLASLIPFKSDFIKTAKRNPDVWGPFWIATTVIFMMAAGGNFASYIEFDKKNGFDLYWQYDFEKVTYGAIAIYAYTIAVPLLMYLGLNCWAALEIRFIELLCIYGYSLFIYIPVALLCIIPYNWAQWTIIGLACAVSTGFLVINIWMPVRDHLAKAFLFLIAIALLHIGLALTFAFYFFGYNKNNNVTKG